MTWVQALVLGLVQGLTEFLPISSSAHVRIVSQLFFGGDAGASFTAVIQLGTELAVLIYFAKDIGRLLAAWFVGLFSARARQTSDYRLAWYVIIGSIPISVLGVLLQDVIRTSARNLWFTATTLIVFAVLLAVADRMGTQRRAELTLRDSVGMGLAQSLALIPGVSRSGGTLTAGLLLGLSREAAARYSFLLAIPAVFGAGVFSIPDVLDRTGGGMQASVPQMIAATAVAFVVGYATIAWLLRYVSKHSYSAFVWYRLILGLALIGLLSMDLLPAT
ncbi:undecaprenyl-diphosphate phosphatase [Goodfellowiella coeruleoviolacea]|uniref:Undecaprenyl-diphosphatase n=1 Tax=Goodfellowiella coeruleoviolacea TaxID=334858 RepID=A0AAE3GGI0_9PSEU|nr:undecaprenyl-diphosphate phosphatase [Goodfellowiella coeruleoviolacea]MCP2167821.1 undecaprenyl-diphosphatase [Goodfellowiella coeruleoviolacea]